MASRDLIELLEAFAAHEVRYLIVGAYAVTYHTRPRFTKDLDLWVEPSAENAQRTFSALAAFGAPLEGVNPEDFATPGVVYQMGMPPNRVDVLTSIEAVAFEDAWQRRVPARYGGVPVCYLSRQDLIANKKALGRPQDLLGRRRPRPGADLA